MADKGDKDKAQQTEAEQYPKEWTHAHFVKRLIEAGKGIPLPLARMPEKISLEGEPGKTTIGSIATTLKAETFADPQRRERARIGIINLEGKLSFQSTIVGTEEQVSTQVQLKRKSTSLGAQYTTTEMAVIDIHTHGILDLPPSPVDFKGILTSADESDQMAFVVVTESSRFLVMRTLDTVERTEQEAQKLVDDTRRRLQGSMKVIHQVLGGGSSYYNHNSSGQIKFVLDTCETNKLALYVATGDSNVYSRIK